MATYNYSVTSDFGGSVNIQQLHSEILDENPYGDDLTGIARSGDTVAITFSSSLSGGHQNQLNTFISNFISHPTVWGDLTFASITSSDSPYSCGTSSVLCDTSSGSITVKLPKAKHNINVFIGVQKTAAANTVTIDPHGSDKIDGQSTKTLTAENEMTTFYSDGDKDWILATGNEGVSTADLALGRITAEKGDLIVDDGNIQTVLAVGTNGQVLTADSSTTTGLKWEAAGGGGGGDVTGPGSAMDKEIVVFNGTGGDTIAGAGIRHYGTSATDPSSPTPQAGDKYFNTVLNQEMFYDGSRSKWLSVAMFFEGSGLNGTTNAGVFYRRFNGMTLSATAGPYVPKGTIVSIGFGTTNAVAHTYEILVGGVVVAELASGGAAEAYSNTINADFNGGKMSSRNKTGSAATTYFQGNIGYRLRV